MKLFTQKTVSFPTASVTSNSAAINAEFSYNFTAQVAVTGTVTIQMQHSNDNATWHDISSASASAGSIISFQTAARFIRATFTPTGNASATVILNGKP